MSQLYPSITRAQLFSALYQCVAAGVTQIDTIDLHLMCSGSGRSDTGRAVDCSRLAAFGKFVAKCSGQGGTTPIDRRSYRKDSAGRRTSCAVWCVHTLVLASYRVNPQVLTR